MPMETPTPSTPEPEGPGENQAWSCLCLAAATAAEWLAQRRRLHDPWRHALNGLAHYIRLRA